MNNDELYQQFVEEHFTIGRSDIPPDWPTELRKRCSFFLRMVENGAKSDDNPTKGSSTAVSLMATLSAQGVRADISLSSPDQAPHLEQDELSEQAERYVFENELAKGGMGRILLAYDRDFRRRIAVKVLRQSSPGTGLVSRFLEEAQATAQLEHPNIGPVYDLGLDERGVPFFTMKWIRGRNLEEIISGADRTKNFSLIRLVQCLQQSAMGVEFAHSRGVVHRDLKPQNIMVGDYGEVLVVDWGLAKVLSGASDTTGTEGISTSRSDRGVVTLDGSLQGSVRYMAPEQARGQVGQIDQRTDVFGLGTILYQILTGEALYSEGGFDDTLERARAAEFTRPSERGTERTIPTELEEICLRALRIEKSDRYQSAREFSQALQAYIEGIHDAERRAAEATRLFDVAETLRRELRSTVKRETELGAREDDVRAKIRDSDPEEQKTELWALLEERGAAREAASKTFNRTTSAYQAVLSVAPGHRDARHALAEIFHGRMLEAEERDDRDAERLYEGMVRQYNDGQYDTSLEGSAILKFDSNPSGATLVLSRYVERGLLLVESDTETIGTTPIERALPRGSYLAVLKKEGYHDVRYPFVLDRRPKHVASVPLHEEGTILEGFVQIPGGESVIGGEPHMLSTLTRERHSIPEFFIGTFPVTFEEYCLFLNDFESDPPEDFIPSFDFQTYVEKTSQGQYATIARYTPTTPVSAISRSAMSHYCDWLSDRHSRPIRLLNEFEWERSARGADGRAFPWGNGFDWSFCTGGRSRPGRPFPQPVGLRTRDVSPFGVRDLAGGIRDVCDGAFDEEFMPLRGGSWFNPHVPVFRTDARTSIHRTSRSTDAGFRVCYSPKNTEK